MLGVDEPVVEPEVPVPDMLDPVVPVPVLVPADPPLVPPAPPAPPVCANAKDDVKASAEAKAIVAIFMVFPRC
jgi:hypothetical protein